MGHDDEFYRRQMFYRRSEWWSIVGDRALKERRRREAVLKCKGVGPPIKRKAPEHRCSGVEGRNVDQLAGKIGVINTSTREHTQQARDGWGV
jgi:hypothetical protein